MVGMVRSALAAVIELVREVDERFARTGIENAGAAVRANDHRSALAAAAKTAVEEDTTLLTSA